MANLSLGQGRWRPMPLPGERSGQRGHGEAAATVIPRDGARTVCVPSAALLVLLPRSPSSRSPRFGQHRGRAAPMKGLCPWDR